MPGPAPIGVPNFFIDKFRIPPFLLPIYQAAGIEYGVRWEVLAAINEIETDYGRNLNVSTAGALGWMQFMPATWKPYGVDANGDGSRTRTTRSTRSSPPRATSRPPAPSKDLRKAIFAYNHADWYVDSVLMRARLIGGLPANFVGSLTGLTQGHFPVAAKAPYADDLTERDAKKPAKRSRKQGNRALVVEGSKHRRGIKIFASRGAPVIAVNDGKIVRVGEHQAPRPLRPVPGRLRQHLHVRAPGQGRQDLPRAQASARRRARPSRASSSCPARTPSRPRPPPPPRSARAKRAQARAAPQARPPQRAAPRGRHQGAPVRQPGPPQGRPRRRRAAALRAHRQDRRRSTFRAYFTKVFGLNRKDVRLKKLRPGSRVVAGTILGRIGRTSSTQAPHMLFEIRPAGRGAPRIDPKPILDGWKLLESTAIYRAAGKNPFFGPDAKTPSIGQILLMSKEALAQRVLANPRIELYDCGRGDIRTGQIDRRVLATLEFLAASGLRPTVTSLKCGHGFLTASGNVSQHSSGNAVDIATINGIPILGNQGNGSITELAIRAC